MFHGGSRRWEIHNCFQSKILAVIKLINPETRYIGNDKTFQMFALMAAPKCEVICWSKHCFGEHFLLARHFARYGDLKWNKGSN